MVSNWVFVISLCCMVVLFIAVVWVQSIVKRQLKKHYANNPDTPDVTFNPLDHSARQTLIFLRFIASKQYKHLSDAKLLRHCNALRLLYGGYLVIFVWVAIAIIIKPSTG